MGTTDRAPLQEGAVARNAGALLRRTVRGQRRDLVLSSLLVAGHQMSEAAVPVAVGVVIDVAVSTG